MFAELILIKSAGTVASAGQSVAKRKESPNQGLSLLPAPQIHTLPKRRSASPLQARWFCRSRPAPARKHKPFQYQRAAISADASERRRPPLPADQVELPNRSISPDRRRQAESLSHLDHIQVPRRCPELLCVRPRAQ